MGLFGNRQSPDAARADALERRLAECERLIATLVRDFSAVRADASEAAERAYKFMKKAEARARREAEGSDRPNQDPGARVRPADTPARAPLQLTAVRARRFMRQQQRAAMPTSPDEFDEATDESNGTDS